MILVRPIRYFEGYTPPDNEAHIDHIYPKSLAGCNCFANAQVLSRAENLAKGNKIENDVEDELFYLLVELFFGFGTAALAASNSWT